MPFIAIISALPASSPAGAVQHARPRALLCRTALATLAAWLGYVTAALMELPIHYLFPVMLAARFTGFLSGVIFALAAKSSQHLKNLGLSWIV